MFRYFTQLNVAVRPILLWQKLFNRVNQRQDNNSNKLEKSQPHTKNIALLAGDKKCGIIILLCFYQKLLK